MKKETKAPKLTEQENYNLAYELKVETETYVNRSFNFIQLAVLEKYTDNMLFENIREEIDPEEYFNNLDESEQKELKKEFAEETGNKYKKAIHSDFIEWIKETKADEVRDYQDRNGRENYPMWNTCFEFRHKPTEAEVEAAQKAGFGIIEGLDDFNTILFVRGAGYSFYASHWIPFYLEIPFNSMNKGKYKGVKFQMV